MSSAKGEFFLNFERHVVTCLLRAAGKLCAKFGQSGRRNPRRSFQPGGNRAFNWGGVRETYRGLWQQCNGWPRRLAHALVEAAREFGLTVPEGYPDMFENLQEPAPEYQRETLLLSLADAVRTKFVASLRSEADKIVSNSALPTRSPASVENCSKRLALMVPSEASEGLANILNAAWTGWLDPQFFRDPEHNGRRLENLREVVLKSIEVLEIESRLEAAA